MKRSGDIHRQNRQSDRGCRRPGARPGYPKQDKPGQGCHDMPADQGARLRWHHFRRSDDEHDGGRKRDDDQRIVGRDRAPLHSANRQNGSKTGNGSRQTIAVIAAADRVGRRLQPIPSHSVHHKQEGRQIALPPRGLERIPYFRLVMAVRSAESLTMPAAPHQLEPKPPGLVGVNEPVN